MDNRLDDHCFLCDIVYLRELDIYVPKSSHYDMFPGRNITSGVCSNDLCMLDLALRSTDIEEDESELEAAWDEFMELAKKKHNKF